MKRQPFGLLIGLRPLISTRGGTRLAPWGPIGIVDSRSLFCTPPDHEGKKASVTASQAKVGHHGLLQSMSWTTSFSELAPRLTVIRHLFSRLEWYPGVAFYLR